ncbi:MAG: hypothetical protein K8F62_16955 [Pseudorhodoplanes sp.]|nr:hypothetical protein [Pseudorhodoplanes sp.]
MRSVFRLCIFLTACLFTSGVGMIAAARLPHPDLLAQYEAIMPGQSIDAVAAYPCPLRVGMSNGEEVGFCQMDMNDGVFSKATIIDANHRIARIDLVVQPGRLRLGDLVVCWGDPSEIIEYGRSDIPMMVNMRWYNRMDANLTRAEYEGQQDYFLPVKSLSLRANYTPCGLN